MSLLTKMRQWWYTNTPEPFDLGGVAVTRGMVWTYGGPAPRLGCETCQQVEWLARVTQTPMVVPEHRCRFRGWALSLAERQGNDDWTQYHQNFFFAVGLNEALPAPRILCLFDERSNMWQRFWEPGHCDHLTITLRRMLARTGQVKVVRSLEKIDWGQYDVLFFQARGKMWLPGRRPPIPVVALGHDLQHPDTQAALDRLEPDFLITSNPEAWQARWRVPARTRVVYHPLGCLGTFFARPNLDPERKMCDLLVVGARRHSTYAPRVALDQQLKPLTRQFDVRFHYGEGHHNQAHINAPVRGTGAVYLNGWSELLGSARFVVFGPNTRGLVVGKTLECLGSGAIPILPTPPDFAYLRGMGLAPYQHYIPLSDVMGEGGNERLVAYLGNYEQYRYIAENAVLWHWERVDWMLYDVFEDVIRKATGEMYPVRLVC